MKCIVHVCKPLGSSHFELRVTPINPAGISGALETYDSEDAVFGRMDELGFTKCCRNLSPSNLRSPEDAVCAVCKISGDAFETFGQPSS